MSHFGDYQNEIYCDGLHSVLSRLADQASFILKGICYAVDERRTIDRSADCISCSNLGDRKANGGIAAIGMLPSKS